MIAEGARYDADQILAYLKEHRQLLWDFIHLYAQRTKRREFLKNLQA